MVKSTAILCWSAWSSSAVIDALVLYAIYLAGPPIPDPISSTDLLELIWVFFIAKSTASIPQ